MRLRPEIHTPFFFEVPLAKGWPAMKVGSPNKTTAATFEPCQQSGYDPHAASKIDGLTLASDHGCLSNGRVEVRAICGTAEGIQRHLCALQHIRHSVITSTSRSTHTWEYPIKTSFDWGHCCACWLRRVVMFMTPADTEGGYGSSCAGYTNGVMTEPGICIDAFMAMLPNRPAPCASRLPRATMMLTGAQAAGGPGGGGCC